MNTFSRVAVVLIGMTSLAAAQGAAKAPVSKVPPTPKPADPAMAMKPPQEVADMAKAMSGTWNCTGQASDPATQKPEPMTAKLKVAVAVDGWWLHDSFESKMGKEPYKFESYMTFDGKTKRWQRVMVSTYGGWNTGDSAGLVNNKMDWELTAHTPMGAAGFRDHWDLSDPKAGAKMSGEVSPDGGKNWLPVYSMTCKK